MHFVRLYTRGRFLSIDLDSLYWGPLLFRKGRSLQLALRVSLFFPPVPHSRWTPGPGELSAVLVEFRYCKRPPLERFIHYKD